MLFEGRKFHLRTYFLIATINGKYKTHFYDLYELFTAEKQYNNNGGIDVCPGPFIFTNNTPKYIIDFKFNK
jgi:hypothetical protein